MQTSVIFPSVERQDGFTLLELLIVLVLVAAVASITLPNLLRMQEAWLRRTAEEDLFNQIQGLGTRVRNSGQEMVIGAGGTIPGGMLQLSEGWQVSAQPPVHYLANGVCLGGRLQVLHEGSARTIHLEPPYCIPEGFQ